MIVFEERERIKREVRELFEGEVQSGATIDEIGDHGHAAAEPTEAWVKAKLEDHEWDLDVYYPYEFLESYFAVIDGGRDEIAAALEETWWGAMSQFLWTKRQLREYENGDPVRPYQQAGFDLVLFYGDSLPEDGNAVVGLNVKSHDSTKSSRPPNIISAYKLLSVAATVNVPIYLL